MKKSNLVMTGVVFSATAFMFQNCTNVRYQYASLEEATTLKSNAFDAQTLVGNIDSSGGAIPSENIRVRSILEATQNMVQACGKSSYEAEKKEALELVKANPKLIAVQYSISFGSKSDDLALVAHNRAILTEKRGVFGDQYIVPFSKFSAWQKSSGGNGYPGYYAKGYYKTDYSKAKSDYVLGKKCFFNVVEVTGEGGVKGKYLNFLTSENVGNAHGSHYLLTGQMIANGEEQFTLYDRLENLQEPQIISLFVADFRIEQFSEKYRAAIMKEFDLKRGHTGVMNTKDIFDMTVLYQGFNDHVWSLSHDFSGENGKIFSSMVGVPQLAHNLMTGALDTSTLVPSQYTPIVLDLGEVGVKTSDAAWGSFFDMAALGAGAHRTAWLGGSFKNMLESSVSKVTDKRLLASVQNGPETPSPNEITMDVRRQADDGFLVIPDDKGRVTSSKNMFGDNLEVGGKKFANGFLALQAFANKDCQSSSVKDRYFGPWDQDLYESKVKIWIDRNRNGVDEAGEIISLKEAGVVALNTCNIVSQQEADSFGNGTALRSAFLFSSNTKIDSLLNNEPEIVKQLEDGESSKGEKAEFRLAVDLIFQTYPDQILPRLEQLSLVSK